MPSRNRLKIYLSDAFYHVYNRGVEKRAIFQDDEDFRVYLNLFKRYLNKKPVKDPSGREYEWLHERIELLAYCLMSSHYHLLVYTHDDMAMVRLLRGVNTSYTIYFNKKYRRIGPLFQDRYKASYLGEDKYLVHISRYIHLNPIQWRSWPYSSLPYYLKQRKAAWIRPKRILGFVNDDYLSFVQDYEEHKKILDELKHNLANY